MNQINNIIQEKEFRSSWNKSIDKINDAYFQMPTKAVVSEFDKSTTVIIELGKEVLSNPKGQQTLIRNSENEEKSNIEIFEESVTYLVNFQINKDTYDIVLAKDDIISKDVKDRIGFKILSNQNIYITDIEKFENYSSAMNLKINKIPDDKFITSKDSKYVGLKNEFIRQYEKLSRSDVFNDRTFLELVNEDINAIDAIRKVVKEELFPMLGVLKKLDINKGEAARG